MQPPAKKFTEDEEMKDGSAQVQTAQSQIGVQPQQQMQIREGNKADYDGQGWELKHIQPYP